MPVTTVSSRAFNQDASGAKKASKGGPVFITDRGRPAYVLLSIEEYRKLAGSPNSTRYRDWGDVHSRHQRRVGAAQGEARQGRSACRGVGGRCTARSRFHFRHHAAVARRAARLQVPDRRAERDVLIAATASVHAMTVVTRNVADFEPTGVTVLNPWRIGTGP